FDRIHDQPLDLLVAQGLLGAAALTWLLVAFARGVWRRPWAGPVAACAAYLVWSLLNFDWAPATGAVWALAGLAWSYAQPPPPPSGRDLPALRGGVAVLGSLAGLLLRAPPPLADVAYHAGHPAPAAALSRRPARS